MDESKRLKEMGTERVIDELNKKYGLLPKPKTAYAGSAGGIEEYLVGLDTYVESLRALPKERHSLPKKEFDNLQDAIKGVKRIAETGSLESLITYLDNRGFWLAKFGTESSGGLGMSEPLQEPDNDDSIYYMTESGATLRVKRAVIKEGLDKVVQMVMEKALFFGPDGEISEVPKLGYKVREYLTTSLLDALESGDFSKYKPKIDIYRKDRNIGAVAKLDEETGRINLTANHTGDRVNKVYMSGS
jgi:hypothetical protein